MQVFFGLLVGDFDLQKLSKVHVLYLWFSFKTFFMNLSTVNSTLTGTSSPTIISGDDLGNYVTFLVLYSNGKTHVPCGMMQQVIINSLLLGWAHKKYLKKKIIRHFLEKRASQTYTNCFPKYGQVSAKKNFLHSNGINLS